MKLFAKTVRWFGADLKIGSRLVIAFAILIALGLIGTVVGSWRLHALQSLAERMATTDAGLMVETEDWERTVESNALRTEIIFFSKDAEIVQKTKNDQQAGVAATEKRNERIKELI